MKAVIFDKRNSPNVLVLREAEKPIPNDNEVLVKIAVVSVNAADYRSMKMGIIPKRKIFGSDIAGRVEAVGKNISRFKAGDEVCGEKNVKIIQSLGADYVINYHVNDFTENGRHYDLILAVNGNHSLHTYKRLLAPKGIFVMVGGALPQVFKSILFGAFMSAGNKKMRFLAAKADRDDLEFILKLAEDGKVKPVIDRHYPLQETAEAVRYLSSGHALGKVIIEVASVPAVN